MSPCSYHFCPALCFSHSNSIHIPSPLIAFLLSLCFDCVDQTAISIINNSDMIYFYSPEPEHGMTHSQPYNILNLNHTIFLENSVIRNHCGVCFKKIVKILSLPECSDERDKSIVLQCAQQ